MKTYSKMYAVRTHGKGLVELTSIVREALRDSAVHSGQVVVFVKHTSASLVIMENADPSAQRDLEEYFERLVPENEPYFTHTYEGPDDMPSHIRMALTRTSEVIPVVNGAMTLGTWQGVFLFEHRSAPHNREIVVSILGE